MIEMKILGQDEDGRLIISGEGELVNIKRPIPGDSSTILMHFCFNYDKDANDKDANDKGSRIDEENQPSMSYDITDRFSILTIETAEEYLEKKKKICDETERLICQ